MNSSPSVPQQPAQQALNRSQPAPPLRLISAWEAGVALDDWREDGLQLTPEQISLYQAIVTLDRMKTGELKPDQTQVTSQEMAEAKAIVAAAQPS